ncbi:MAG TPA: cyclic nucleotide-binding domain-containing protein [Gaiellaceae bacterium]|jgi:CRP-like cAMP-binding protein
MPGDVALLETASRLALFADLGEAELDLLLPSLQEASYNEGEWVLRRGQERVGIYIIVDGEVGILLEDEELATLSRGSFFGEISALLGEPTVADVIARAPLWCLLVPSDQVEQFLVSNPRVMYRMLQTEARRLQMTDERRV